MSMTDLRKEGRGSCEKKKTEPLPHRRHHIIVSYLEGEISWRVGRKSKVRGEDTKSMGGDQF